MTPIEAVATMDKSFQQRRLLEGKSTENIFSLRKIIEDAHGVQPNMNHRTGETDAVQVESTSPLPVREGTGSGEGVRIEDAELGDPPATCVEKEKEKES
jgi:hypothetical protein